MIKKIRSSLTIKICLLISVLLIAASGITYAVIAGFLPTYYSSRLEQELDEVSQEMAETIGSYEKIEDAFSAIELFETGSQVTVVILNEQGNMVWPEQIEHYSAAEEDVVWSSMEAEYGAEEAEEDESPADMREAITVTIPDENDAGAQEEGAEEQKTAEAAADAVTVNVDGVVEYDYEDAGQNGVIGLLMYYNGAVSLENAEEMNSAVKHYDIVLGGADYTMIVAGGMQPVNQAMEILYQIFPYILAVSVGVALIFAAAASLYLTAPVVRLSQTAQNMASLDFTDRYQGKRRDEIGKLGRSLNELSANLSAALWELHEANEKLKEDIEREMEAERRQIEFFSAVSHELKTPITILQGHLSGMLQGIGEYQDRERYLKRSLATAEKMKGMVEELLTVSRIENNTFTTCRTDVAEQLRQQLADMTELIEEKNLISVVDIPDHLYAEVNPGMMEKVFRNLLINAIRYTPVGAENEIRVAMYENCGLRCSVENTGVFIAEEALPHLFEAFYRAEQSRNSQTGGSGLGLYIVKMVLEQHGAQYGIENTAEGVRAWFSMENASDA